MLVRPYKKILKYHAAGISPSKKREILYKWKKGLNERKPNIANRNELVFDYLLSLADKNGTILAPPEVIATACHLSLSQVNVTLRKMSQAELIRRKSGVIFLIDIEL